MKYRKLKPNYRSNRPASGALRRLRAVVAVAIFFSLPLAAETRGQADVAVQGFYYGGSGQPVDGVSGLAVHFQYFLSKVGLLEGNVEDYSEQSRLRTGQNFLRLRGTPLAGRNWTFTLGDFRMPMRSFNLPITNLYMPELLGRGMAVTAEDARSSITVFAGQQVLMAGPRIPFNVSMPVNVAGIATTREITGTLSVASRIVRVSWQPWESDAEWLFPVTNTRERPVSTWTNQFVWKASATHEVFGEAGISTPDPGQSSVSSGRFSGLAGWQWDTPRIKIRANYSSFSANYFPFAGSYAGDRRGPFAEFHVQPFEWLDVYGSASRYRNNLNDAADISAFRSGTETLGAGARLPGKFYLSAQMTWLALNTRLASDTEESRSDNRQTSATLAQTVKRHNLRYTWRSMSFRSNSLDTRQQSYEVRDNVFYGRWGIGGAVRLDSSKGSEQRNSIFYQANGSLRLGRITVNGNMEFGHDLLNESLFSMQAVSTSSAGVTARLSRYWTLDLEGLRNRLASTINPERLFLYASNGVPVNPLLAGLDHWTFFFRFSRSFSWGGLLPAKSSGGSAIREMYPVVGVVEGLVTEAGSNGRIPAPGVKVDLDTGRSVVTNESGLYRFDNVPVGPHRVGLAMRFLPADYEPAGPTELELTVQANRQVSGDMLVQRLGRIEGRIQAPSGLPVDSIVVRLTPGSRYTTPDSDGTFAFYNVPAGSYHVVLDVSTLPKKSRLDSEASQEATLSLDNPVPLVAFRLEVVKTERPVVFIQLTQSPAAAKQPPNVTPPQP